MPGNYQAGVGLFVIRVERGVPTVYLSVVVKVYLVGDHFLYEFIDKSVPSPLFSPKVSKDSSRKSVDPPRIS